MSPTPSIEYSPQLASLADALWNQGKTPADCAAIIRAVQESRISQAPVFALKESFRSFETELYPDAVERLLLACAVHESTLKIDSLLIHASVKALIHNEFRAYLTPPGSGLRLIAGTNLFVVASKIATLRRFPAGPMDWVVSGIPRSWILKMPIMQAAAALRCILKWFGGFKPAFYVHLAPPPRNRALVIPKEVRKAYYRMAKSLERQPEMKGIVCAAWFHDQDVLRETPHLYPLNEPYIEHGGRIVVRLGPAPADSGFLQYNPERRKLYESGRLQPNITLALWPRMSALLWAEQHPELER